MNTTDNSALQADLQRLQAEVASLQARHEGFIATTSYERTLFNSMLNFAVIGTDLAGRITHWNSGAEHVLGWTAAEMLGAPADRIFTPEDRALLRPETEMASAREHGQAGDYRWHMRSDDSRFWASGEMTLVRDAQGQQCGYLKVLQDRTQAHLKSVELTQSQEQYQRLLNSIDTGFCVIQMKFDAQDRPCDYKFIEANRAFEQHTGLSDVVGQWVRDMVPDQDQHWFDLYGAVARTGKSLRLEDYGQALGRWFEVHATAVDSESGLVAVLFSDITDRRAAEDALRQSEEYWRGLFERLNDGFILGELVRDQAGNVLDWRYIDVNQAWADQVGITVERAKGKTIREMLPGVESFWIEQAALAVSTGKSSAFNHQVGRIGRWYEGRVHPLDGDRFTIIFQEITETRRAATKRQALLELSDSLRDMHDPDQMVSAACDTLGTVLEGDTACYLSIDKDQQPNRVGHPWTRRALTGSAGSLGTAALDRALKSLPWRIPLAITDVSLDPRFVASRALQDSGVVALLSVPLIEENRTVASLILIRERPHAWSEDECRFALEVAERTHSAVARRVAENDLQALNASLEEVVEQRTEELLRSQELLRQSQKMEVVGQLTGGIAHDFNNLLTGISGSLEMMQNRIQQGRINEIEKYVAAAHSASRRAASLTHRLLAFSRRQTLDPKPTQLNRLIAGMQELIDRTVGPGIETRMQLDDALWTTHVDANQLENALLNLCINARDAMPDGGQLIVETRNHTLDSAAADELSLKPGEYVSLCVTDSGTGMSPDVVEKAFEPFFTTKPLGMGTGLGLSMIYGFIRQSGGHARIESQMGAGTRVGLYLPRFIGQEAASESVGLQEMPRAGNGETVLVVDDEPTVRLLVTEILEELGYQAIEAADGRSGLQILDSNVRIDLLVTDVGLPGGMNGRQMADLSRANRPQLKVLFITGYAESAVIGNGDLDANMHIMTKPFSVEGLAVRIKSLIESP